MENNTHSDLQATGITRWLIAIAVMLVAVIEVLDVTIVNVALSHMMGALGATRDQVTWVLTSYIVSSAIMMPLTGFLVGVLGRKRLLLISISGFLVSSMLCGFSQTLAQMVLFRILQGTFGAVLIPLSQFVLLDTFSKEERGKAMAIWGIGVMVGPILGPTLGGLITDIANWRWIFYINAPFCIIALVMTWELIKESPQVPKSIDWVGLFWMIIGIGSLQIFLDRGQSEDWFNSKVITLLMITCFFTLSIFIMRGLRNPNNIINLNLFRDANFSKACLIMVLFAMGVFSLITMQPIMMQELMEYSPYKAGLVMAPRGITSALAMVFVAKFIAKMDPRWFVATGLFILIGTAWIMSHFDLHTSFKIMAEVNLIQGVGIGLIFVPLSTIAFNTLSASQEAEAAGLFNFCRSIGTSIGIALSSALLARASQASWNNLAGNFTLTNANLQNWLQAHHLTMQDEVAIVYLSTQLVRQSSIVAFINVYWIIGLFFFIALPFVFFLRKPSKPITNVVME